MRVELIRRGHFGHLYLSGRFDSLELSDLAWQRWSDAVHEASRASRGVLTFVDLRDISYADSRAIHRLLEVVEPLRQVGEIIFLGPGTGFARLAALGEAPRLVPMLDTAPWESGEASEVQLEELERDGEFSAEFVTEEARARSEFSSPETPSSKESGLESGVASSPSSVEIPEEIGAHEWERSVEGDIRSWLESLNVEVATPSGESPKADSHGGSAEPNEAPATRPDAGGVCASDSESEESPTETISPAAGIDWAQAFAATIEEAVAGGEGAMTDPADPEPRRSTITAVRAQEDEPTGEAGNEVENAPENEPMLEPPSEPAPVFEIDLGREALYLSHPSDARDYIVSHPTLSFAPGWTSVAGLNEPKERAPRPVSPIEWLRRAGGSGASPTGTESTPPSRSDASAASPSSIGDRSPARSPGIAMPPESQWPPVERPPTDSGLSDDPPDPPRHSWEERLAAKAERLGAAPRRADPADGCGSSPLDVDPSRDPDELDREREARDGLQRVVEAIGRVEAEKDEWRERARQLERRLESERVLRERAERERDERERAPRSGAPGPSERSIPMYDLGELDAASDLLARFGAGVRQFHVHGQLDRTAWLRLVADAAALGPAVSQQWTGTLDTIPDPTDALGGLAVYRSRGFALSISTLVREGCTGRSLRWAARNLAVAALLESTPGRDWRLESGADRTAREVAALLAEGQFLFPDEGEAGVGRPEGEMEVWQAASKLAISSERLTTGWPAAIHAVLRETRPGRPARRGLTRVVQAHSIYLPGSWVELTSGEIGLVIAPSEGFPEMPRILVQFGRLGDRSIPIAPRWFPSPDGEVATVARVLEGPRICEETEWSSGGDPRR